MGVDLKLLPVDAEWQESGGQHGYAHSILEMDRDSGLWTRIESLNPHERPTFTLSSYVSRVPDGTKEGESCYGDVTETPYGQPLTYVDSLALADVIDAHEASQSDESKRNRAVAAYLRLIRRTTVALYWN